MGDLWLALRSHLPRPLDPVKFHNFGQEVKQRYLDELPWMRNDMNVTFHKIVDHSKEILEKIPDTLRISMFDEEPIEVFRSDPLLSIFTYLFYVNISRTVVCLLNLGKKSQLTLISPYQYFQILACRAVVSYRTPAINYLS